MNVEDVVGGRRVRVLQHGDDTFFPEYYCGRVGRVRAVVLDDHGASPTDPFVIVAFHGVGTDGFWLGELELEES